MGNRHAKPSSAMAPPEAAVALVEPSAETMADFSKFLGTAAGIEWWSIAIDDLEQRVLRVAPRPPSFTELNRMVIKRFQSFMSSDKGQAFKKQLHQEITGGSLTVPVCLVEELLKARVRAVLHRNMGRYTFSFGWRAAVCSAAFHLFKQGIKRLVRKRRRARAVADFLCDVVFPTAFFGPVLGVMLGLLEMTGAVPLAAVDGTASTGASSSTPGGAASTAKPQQQQGPKLVLPPAIPLPLQLLPKPPPPMRQAGADEHKAKGLGAGDLAS